MQGVWPSGDASQKAGRKELSGKVGGITANTGVNIQACGNRNQIMYSEIQKPIDFGYAAATWA